MVSKEVWDEVYKNHAPSELPWYNLPFRVHVDKFLKTLNKLDLLIVTGCGVGDTVDKLQKEGFTNILGTDISSDAINMAQKRFPHLNFKCIETEKLYQEGYKNVNALDWLNLHQVSPELVKSYLNSLNKISKSLFLAYFYDPNKPYSRKSMITNGLVYNYNPNFITGLVKNMKKTEESIFYVEPKKLAGRLGSKLRAITQTYMK